MEEALKILSTYWHFDDFRPTQKEIVATVLRRENALAILPTGGGKSLCYQVPSLVFDGICIVVTPLIALMKDQVDQLKKRGIKAIGIHSGMSAAEVDIALDNCIYGDFKLLYISPERLTSELFVERAKLMNVSFLAVDEAHCISQWGHEFRPSYLKISEFAGQVEISHVVALTARATPRVMQEILENLKIPETRIFTHSFLRPNLSYSVFKTENKQDKLLQILRSVQGTGIVYVHSRKQTMELANWLNTQDISADYYHGGLNSTTRSGKQNAWVNNMTRIMVSTNAFGMGIDKPDVRVVVHLDLPDNLESYYQEAGRAGRDGKKSYAVLLYNAEDLSSGQKRVEQSNVPPGFLKHVYQALANYYRLAVGSGQGMQYEFDINQFTQQFSLPKLDTHYALKKLEDDGIISQLDSAFQPSRLHIKVSKEDIYRFQVEHSSLDALTRTILRLYGGELFSDFMPISENDLARLLKTNRQEVIKGLDRLKQYDIVDYLPASAKPKIEFCLPRFDAGNLPINKAKLAERRGLLLDKYHQMTVYAKEPHACRTRILQQYFGEETDEACGVCDNCLKRKRTVGELSLGKVFDQVPDSGISLDGLCTKLKIDREGLQPTIRAMIEEGMIELDESDLIKKTGSGPV